MSDVPSVSVVMPVHNGQRFICEAVDSILAQKLRDWELIIVDDASTDDTPHILRRYVKKDKRIRVITFTSNQGIYQARNRGLRQAQGNYYAVHDADDISDPNRFAEQKQFLEQHPTIAVVGSDTAIVDEYGRRYAMRTYPHTPREVRRAAIRYNPLAHSAAMIRMDVIQYIGGYDESFTNSADYALWLQILSMHEGANIDRALIDYRVHRGQEKRNVKKTLGNTLRAQRPWLLHRRFRSVGGLINYLMELLMLIVPSGLLLMLFKRRRYQSL